MTAMFRDFSFEAASRHPSPADRAEREAMSVSPMSRMELPQPSRLPTPPPCSVGDLAHALDQQNLRVVVDACSFTPSCESLTPPSDDVAFPAGHPVRPPPLSTARLDSAILRRQRQANTRLQCSSSHRKDISALVEKMIETEDQCHTCDRKSLTLPSPASPPSSSSPSPDEDEGIDMEYTPSDPIEELRLLVPLLRATDGNHRARVSKSVRMRMRKKPGISKRPSN